MRTITYLDSGHVQHISVERGARLAEGLDACLGAVTDRLRLLLEQERVAGVLADGEAWSFEFEPAIERELGSFGRATLHRVVIPLRGDLAVDRTSSRLSLLTELGPGEWLAWLCHVDPANPLLSP